VASIIKRLKAHPEDLFAGRGTTPTRITEAEEALGIQFAEDYKKILLEFGVIAFDGHELTGITDNPRISVVDTTKRLRSDNPDISPDWYAIEEANIDGITVWQETSGTVYGIIPGNKPYKLANNLSDYLKL